MIRDTLHDLHRPLGDTGLAVSPLGLGTVKFGRDQGVKYPSGFTIPDDREAADLLALARDLGINLIDTAPAYGRSEERLGPLLRGQREHWVIVSKVGEEFVDGQSVSRRFRLRSTERRVCAAEKSKTDWPSTNSSPTLLTITQCSRWPRSSGPRRSSLRP